MVSRCAALLLTASLVLAGCSGSDSNPAAPTPSPTPDPVPDPSATPQFSKAEAARFLTQATFGPTMSEIDALPLAGYEAWLEQQFDVPMTSHVDYLGKLDGDKNQTDRLGVWWDVALNGPDQLRQRVAFALSEILVVSEREAALGGRVFGLAHYYDMLVKHAFGNYRELLGEVTLSPAMGKYLSMLGNERPDAERNIRPDENYARELMQLFTIGLVQLNIDGTPVVDGEGEPIPTYDQDIIEGFAHVFTGWTFAFAENWEFPRQNFFSPMTPWAEFHDDGAKRLLNGVVVPAGQNARQDLEQALDNVFNHPNVAPFVSRQLIQKLITSNPSPQYVARVATVFNDDGAGARGNLRAVVKAIYLDEEARNGHLAQPTRFGKLKEPLLRQTALWRAFGARAANGRYLFFNPDRDFGQAPLRSPSVFNFFQPGYAQPGAVADQGLVAPEFQILDETTITSTTNRLSINIFNRHSGLEEIREDWVVINIDSVKALAADPAAMVGHLNLLLMNERMSAEMRGALTTLLEETPLGEGDDGAARALEAIYIITTSPEFAVQK